METPTLQLGIIIQNKMLKWSEIVESFINWTMVFCSHSFVLQFFPRLSINDQSSEISLIENIFHFSQTHFY